MGNVVDFVEFKQKSGQNRIELEREDGTYMETVAPFIIFRHYEAGAIRKEWRVISEYMLREMIESMT
ncbi:MAG: hypothetical protein ABSF90_20035 [Syntrophobacteraceae bacterium]|jgi:hypothetical protein